MNEDFGGDIITISDEDGNEFDLELLDTIEFEGQTYCVFVPADIENMDVNDPDYGLIFLKSREENGEELFDSVDDDDELDRVYEYYQQIMEAEEEKELREAIFVAETTGGGDAASLIKLINRLAAKANLIAPGKKT